MTGAAVAFTCPHCDHVISAEVRGHASWDGWPQDRGQGPESLPVRWRLLQCTRCSQVAVDAREEIGPEGQLDDSVIIFPGSRQLAFDIPEGLRDEWLEANVCYRSKAYKACAVMVRRTLEGTCKENGVQERVLGNALRVMLSEGKIDDTLFSWANQLRVVGNQGAHYSGKQVSREDAQDALAFAEALLDHIYVLRRRFEEFKKRQG